MAGLPIIDITPLREADLSARQGVASALGRACRETGFFCVVGHGLEQQRLDRVFDATRTFFALPLAEKARLSIDRSPHNRGYVGLGAENLDPSALPDRKEAFNIGLELDADHEEIVAAKPLRGMNLWPAIDGWQSIMLDYYERCLDIGRTLHRGFSLDLGISETFFEDRLVLPAAFLRLLHYPASGRPDVPSDGSAVQPGAGEHTDYGNVTLLATDGVAGLEVRRRDGTWLEVAGTDDMLLCNIGDCLMRWTNDVYVSTPHRVRVPDAERYSVAFFLDANPDARVEPILSLQSPTPRHAPVTVRDYLLDRLNATYAHRRSAGAAS